MPQENNDSEKNPTSIATMTSLCGNTTLSKSFPVHRRIENHTIFHFPLVSSMPTGNPFRPLALKTQNIYKNYKHDIRTNERGHHRRTMVNDPELGNLFQAEGNICETVSYIHQRWQNMKIHASLHTTNHDP